MEIFELRYFLAVAERENMNRAAEEISVSPASLSKAVARLESELGVKLFERVSRNIRLTAEGRALKRRASEIIALEAAARAELRGKSGAFAVRVCGPEILLAQFAPTLCTIILRTYPHARFELFPCSDNEAVERISADASHLAITTATAPAGFSTRTVAETNFRTFVGRSHPLYRSAKSERAIPIEELLEYAFASPDKPILGLTRSGQSNDGWRDDKFPRKIRYTTSSLEVLEELVTSGMAIAYLPDSFAERIPVAPLKVTGCPYTCKQTIRFVAKQAESTGWLLQLFR